MECQPLSWPSFSCLQTCAGVLTDLVKRAVITAAVPIPVAFRCSRAMVVLSPQEV